MLSGLLQLAQQLSPEEVQLFYQIALLGRRDLPLAPERRGGFEMVMLRMLAFRRDTMAVQPAQNLMPSAPQLTTSSTPQAPVQNAPPPVASPSPTNPSIHSDDWGTIVQSLELTGLVKQLAINCELKQRKGNTWYLSLSPKHKLLFTEDRKQKIEHLLQKHQGHSQSVHIRVEHPNTETPAIAQQRIAEARQSYVAKAIQGDPFVIYMKENCDARINNVQLSVNSC